MRWRLGRSTTKKKAPDRPVGSIVAPSSQARTINTTAAGSGIHRQQIVGSSETGPSTGDGDDGDELYCATAATCRRLRGRNVNGEPANGGRPCALDGLSASLISYVERLGSRPRPEPSPLETRNVSGISGTTTGQDDDGGTEANSHVEESRKSSIFTLGERIHGSQTAGPLSPSPSPIILKTATTQEEDRVISEIRDCLLRRGADQNVAAGAARLCLALILSRESTQEAMQGLGPLELVSLTTANLGLSDGATAFLLAHLVDKDLTAAWLATAGTGFNFSHLCSPSVGAGRIRNGEVEGGVDTALQCHVGAKTNDRALSRIETVVTSGEENEEAVAGATALSLACHTWRDIVSAVSDMAGSRGPDYRSGAFPEGANQKETMRGSAAEIAPSPYDTTWCCPLEPRKDQDRSGSSGKSERSTAATAATAEWMDGSQEVRVRCKIITCNAAGGSCCRIVLWNHVPPCVSSHSVGEKAESQYCCPCCRRWYYNNSSRKKTRLEAGREIPQM